MDFELTSEQKALRDEAREFVRTLVAPGAQERDGTKEYPRDLIAKAAARGWAGCLVPEQYGGSALGNVGQCLVLEEFAAGCASTHLTLSVHNSLACGPIVKWGTDELKQRYLPKLAKGELLGAYLLTEPGSGSDAAAMKTTAVQDGDEWVIDGDKLWITTGDEAQVGVVFARTDLNPATKSPRAISAFVVDFDLPGVSFGKREPKMGLRANPTIAVYLKQVRVPAGNLLGQENRGFNTAMETLNGGRIGIAIQSIGIARAALEVALDSLRHVQRDGKALGQSQLAQWKVSDIATNIDAARLLAYRAAKMRDAGVPHIMEASMAKLFASRMANEACRQVVELLGEVGYGDRSTAERLLRDVRVTELYEGTTEVQRLVIAKQLLAD